MGNQEDVENRIAAALFTGCLAERNGRLLVSQRTTPGKLYVGISSPRSPSFAVGISRQPVACYLASRPCLYLSVH